MGDDDLVRWLMSGTGLLALPRWPDWMLDARCVAADPSLFILETGGSPKAAKRICAGCPVREPCLEYALEQEGPTAPLDYRTGIWGGTTPRERDRLARDRRMMPAA